MEGDINNNSSFSVLAVGDLYKINGGGLVKGKTIIKMIIHKNISLEGKVEFDESTGKPKGSASTKIGISVSRKKN